jgi:hypothetical protein
MPFDRRQIPAVHSVNPPLMKFALRNAQLTRALRVHDFIAVELQPAHDDSLHQQSPEWR